jgi:hypothetical protein
VLDGAIVGVDARGGVVDLETLLVVQSPEKLLVSRGVGPKRPNVRGRAICGVGDVPAEVEGLVLEEAAALHNVVVDIAVVPVLDDEGLAGADQWVTSEVVVGDLDGFAIGERLVEALVDRRVDDLGVAVFDGDDLVNPERCSSVG